MTILFDATSTRKPARQSHPFAVGLGRNRTERLPIGPSDADRQWAASHLNAKARDYCLAGQSAPPVGMPVERLAAEAEALDRHERGYCL